MKKSHVHILKHWHKLDYYERNQKLKEDRSLLLFVLECLHNILNGVVAIDKNELKKFESSIRRLIDKNTSLEKRITHLYTKTGHLLILFISKPCLKTLDHY